MAASPRAEALLASALAQGQRGPPLLLSMLALLGDDAVVRFDDHIDMAALSFEGDRFAILIGAAAVERGTLDADDLLYLLAHELCHLIRDEHRLPPDPRRAAAANIAADAINDAWLTGPTFGGFFDPMTSLPARRPPTHPLNGLMLPSPAAKALVEAQGHGPLDDEAQVSRRLFDEVIPPQSGGALPYRPEAWAVTHRVLQQGGRDATLSAAFGTELVLALFDQLAHPPSLPLTPLANMLATEEGRRRLEEMRKNFGQALGHSGAGGTEAGPAGEVTTLTVRRAAAEVKLERFLRKVAFEVDSIAGVWSPMGPGAVAREAGSLVTARSACDYRAGLRATPMAERRPVGGERPVGIELYLDSSGSMEGDLPTILASLVTRCPDLLGPVVRVFSVGLRSVTARALRERRLPTDGGTDFDALAADLIKRRVPCAVVISDGVSAALGSGLLDELRRRRVKVAMVFPRAIGTSPLDALCPPGWRVGLGLKAGGRA